MKDYDMIYERNRMFLEQELDSNRFRFANTYIKEGDDVLDVGCANGNLMKHITKSVNYYGLDISTKAIKDNPYPSKVDDAETFRYNMRFDKIVCLECVEHLDNPIVAIANMVAHLKPNGVLLITVPINNRLACDEHKHTFNYKGLIGICKMFTNNFRISPIKKYDMNDEENIYSVVIQV